MNSAPSPSASPSPAPKKGLSGLAFAGIGCGALLVMGGVVMLVLIGKGCQMAKDFASDVQKNPARAAAELAVKMNPDLELVRTDDAKGEITVRQKSNGEEITLSFDDIAKGKFTVRNSKGEETSVDAGSANGEGKIVVKGANGETTTFGAGANMQAPPAWLPAYPGATSDQSGGFRAENGGKVSGVSTVQTADDVQKVKAFYDSKLKEAGFKTEITESDIGGQSTAMIHAQIEADGKTASIVITTQDGKTQIVTQYEGPKQ